ncbi:MAG: archaeal proteasome endopeptidase complex subunit alpha [Nanoarchaeota archaeon]
MTMNKQMIDKMGYDRSITMFAPDGRLLQVEYAKKTVKQGSTALAIACKDGVVFVSDKRINSKLIVPEAIEKMFKVDDHIGVAAAGIISDARVLVDRSQLRAQQHYVTFESKIDVLSIVKEICDLKQICTQSAGLRPFGVSLLVGGVEEDGSVKLFLTEPYGLYFQYRAAVIGEGEAEVDAVLQKRYRSSMTVDEGIKLGLQAIKEFLKQDFNVERVDVAFIEMKEKRWTKLSDEEIGKALK